MVLVRNFTKFVQTFSAAKSCDASISLDWRFGDFPIAGIALDTNELPACVASRGHYFGVPLGPKIIFMLSRARRYARI
ncbi:unnamed protein product [Prunus armeniaca]